MEWLEANGILTLMLSYLGLAFFVTFMVYMRVRVLSRTKVRHDVATITIAIAVLLILNSASLIAMYGLSNDYPNAGFATACALLVAWVGYMIYSESDNWFKKKNDKLKSKLKNLSEQFSHTLSTKAAHSPA